MWIYNYTPSTDELYHHGILGQKWGVRNGPPYPLGSGKHSTAETKARRSSSVGSSRKSGDVLSMTASFLAVSCATILYTVVKAKVNEAQTEREYKEKYSTSESILAATPAKKLSKPESIADTAKKANSLVNAPEGMNNCTLCGLASALRRAGYDVTAGTTWGNGQSSLKMARRYFDGPKRRSCPGKLVNSSDNAEKISKWMLDEYGDNAYGIVSVGYNMYNMGHCFSWAITNGKVQFYDAQAQLVDASSNFKAPYGLSFVDTIRLDNCAVKEENVTSQLNL